jgi:hypothetical protein
MLQAFLVLGRSHVFAFLSLVGAALNTLDIVFAIKFNAVRLGVAFYSRIFSRMTIEMQRCAMHTLRYRRTRQNIKKKELCEKHAADAMQLK